MPKKRFSISIIFSLLNLTPFVACGPVEFASVLRNSVFALEGRDFANCEKFLSGIHT